MPETRDDPITTAMRFWPVVLLTMIVCGAGLGYVANAQAQVWTSTAKVLYGLSSTSALSGISAADGDIERTLATQVQVVMSDQVMSPAAKELGVSLKTLLNATEVDNLPDSSVISISVDGPTAAEATRRAERVSTGYVAYVRTLATENLTKQADALNPSIDRLREQIAARGGARRPAAATLVSGLASVLDKQLQLTVAAGAEEGPAKEITAAQAPSDPTSYSATTGAVVGAGIGLVLGIGLALVLGRVRRRPARRTSSD